MNYELKEVVESNDLYCPIAKCRVDMSKSRQECAKLNKCKGWTCALNVEFYVKAAARALGWCK